MSEYPKGNSDVLKMLESGRFDDRLAEELLRGIDLNSPICDSNGCSTTYLYEAVAENNLPAVDFLLKHGANPNLYDPNLTCDCALWALQYLDVGQDWQTRYEICKLFFQHGADPNIRCDGETLYDYIVFKVYNDTALDENDWENLLHLYKLLVIYGGGSECGAYGKPDLKSIDLNKTDEYRVRFSKHEDEYHISGFLVDGDGKIVGEL